MKKILTLIILLSSFLSLTAQKKMAKIDCYSCEEFSNQYCQPCDNTTSASEMFSGIIFTATNNRKTKLYKGFEIYWKGSTFYLGDWKESKVSFRLPVRFNSQIIRSKSQLLEAIKGCSEGTTSSEDVLPPCTANQYPVFDGTDWTCSDLTTYVVSSSDDSADITSTTVGNTVTFDVTVDLFDTDTTGLKGLIEKCIPNDIDSVYSVVGNEGVNVSTSVSGTTVTYSISIIESEIDLFDIDTTGLVTLIESYTPTFDVRSSSVTGLDSLTIYNPDGSVQYTFIDTDTNCGATTQGIVTIAQTTLPGGRTLTETTYNYSNGCGAWSLIDSDTSTQVIQYNYRNGIDTIRVSLDSFKYILRDTFTVDGVENVFVREFYDTFKHDIIAQKDCITTQVNTPVIFQNVCANDDAISSSLLNNSVAVKSGGIGTQGGTFASNNCQVTYTPLADFVGYDTIQYCIFNEFGDSDTTLLIVKIEGQHTARFTNNETARFHDTGITADNLAPSPSVGNFNIAIEVTGCSGGNPIATDSVELKWYDCESGQTYDVFKWDYATFSAGGSPTNLASLSADAQAMVANWTLSGTGTAFNIALNKQAWGQSTNHYYQKKDATTAMRLCYEIKIKSDDCGESKVSNNTMLRNFVVHYSGKQSFSSGAGSSSITHIQTQNNDDSNVGLFNGVLPEDDDVQLWYRINGGAEIQEVANSNAYNPGLGINGDYTPFEAVALAQNIGDYAQFNSKIFLTHGHFSENQWIQGNFSNGGNRPILGARGGYPVHEIAIETDANAYIITGATLLQIEDDFNAIETTFSSFTIDGSPRVLSLPHLVNTGVTASIEVQNWVYDRGHTGSYMNELIIKAVSPTTNLEHEAFMKWEEEFNFLY